MPYKEAQLNVNPNFVIALSGEFSLSTDPELPHMLGQLLVATFQKGELARPESGPTISGGLAYDLSYRPSWASHVTSRICCIEKDGWTAVRSMYLNRDGEDGFDDSLMMQDYPPHEFSGGRLHLAEPGQPHHRPEQLSLALGPELLKSRDVVTRAAQAFFA